MPEVDEQVIVCPDTAWREAFETEVFLPGYRTALEQMHAAIDFAPPLKPGPDDWVATTGRQVHALLNENGIWNVLHAGFDLSNEVLCSPAGGAYWLGRYCRRIVLRDCVTAEEPVGGVAGDSVTNAILDFMEMIGYTATGADIRRAAAAFAE